MSGEGDSVVRRRVSDYGTRRDYRLSQERMTPEPSPSPTKKYSTERMTPEPSTPPTKKHSTDATSPEPSTSSSKRYSTERTTPEPSSSPKRYSTERTPTPTLVIPTKGNTTMEKEVACSADEEENKVNYIKDAVFVTEPTTPLDESGNKKIEIELTTEKKDKEEAAQKEAKGAHEEIKSAHEETKAAQEDAASVGKEESSTEIKTPSTDNDTLEADTKPSGGENETLIIDNDAIGSDISVINSFEPRTPTYSMPSSTDEDFDRLEDAVLPKHGNEDDNIIETEKSDIDFNIEKSEENVEEDETPPSGVECEESEETFLGKYKNHLLCGILVAGVALAVHYVIKAK